MHFPVLTTWVQFGRRVLFSSLARKGSGESKMSQMRSMLAAGAVSFVVAAGSAHAATKTFDLNHMSTRSDVGQTLAIMTVTDIAGGIEVNVSLPAPQSISAPAELCSRSTPTCRSTSGLSSERYQFRPSFVPVDIRTPFLASVFSPSAGTRWLHSLVRSTFKSWVISLRRFSHRMRTVITFPLSWICRPGLASRSAPIPPFPSPPPGR